MPFFDSKLQSGLRPRVLAHGFVLALCLCALVACGKKPPEVDPPVGSQKVVYPRVYPDPHTDPAP